jgi:2-alkenal reductase
MVALLVATPYLGWNTPPAVLAGAFQGDTPTLNSISAELITLYDRVNPAVVSIDAASTPSQDGSSSQNGTMLTAGSGFVYDQEGHIVTNAHNVAHADFIRVRFFNGVTALAQVAGIDANSDLAVLRVSELPDEVHPLPLADIEDVQTGGLVMAVGNPFGQANTMTVGIVSATGRLIPVEATGFNIPQSIQTDAAINLGSSGGPLVNTRGEVIGINARLATPGNPVNSGVAFAIPINVVKLVVPSLIQGQVHTWPWLGLDGFTLATLQARAMGLDMQQGVYVHAIIPGGPAEAAGLRGSNARVQAGGLPLPVGGDVIVEVDGRPVTSYADLLSEVVFSQAGITLPLTVLRDGQPISLDVTLDAQPENLASEDMPQPMPVSPGQ